MSVYKEGFKIVRMIRAASQQIWDDSCDYGALVCKGDPLWMAAKQLFEMYGSKDERTEERYETGATVTATIRLLDEHGSGDEVKYMLEYIKSDALKAKKADGYLNIIQLDPE
jgi:hypothetical protein